MGRRGEEEKKRRREELEEEEGREDEKYRTVEDLVCTDLLFSLPSSLEPPHIYSLNYYYYSYLLGIIDNRLQRAADPCSFPDSIPQFHESQNEPSRISMRVETF